jgi:hypothetical protein
VKLSAYKRIGKILAGREKKIWRRKARKCWDPNLSIILIFSPIRDPQSF